MILRTLPLFLIALTATGLIACTHTGSQAASTSEQPQTNFTQCPEQRPQACTFDYRPVCATVDTEVRCIKAPCPSTTQKTYGNGCSACGDKKVIGYTPGECVTLKTAP